ncbi:hypothetical protein AB0A60_19980 [Streptomyces sp. NPDC046275]|uniref:hypothetical protein n=1 Tax=Streptomyces sp. NPDC046275 TaxID=3157201 RepID=UPI0033F7BAB5
MDQDEDNAILILAGEMEEDIAKIPLPVALHVVENSLGLFGPHAHALGDPLPVTHRWVQAAQGTGKYAPQAKVAVVLAPLPEQRSAADTPVDEGALQPDLPSWIMDVLLAKHPMAVRDVRVSTGFLGLLDVALGAPTQLPEWADVMLP